MRPVRSDKRIAMKAAVDKVVAEINFIKKVLVVRNTNADNISWNDNKGICYTHTQELKKVSNDHLQQAFLLRYICLCCIHLVLQVLLKV